jgi:hypothetical protein
MREACSMYSNQRGSWAWHDPNWATLGHQPRDNAEDYREMLRGQGVDVDAPDREEWAWPEHGGSFARAAERPVR